MPRRKFAFNDEKLNKMIVYGLMARQGKTLTALAAHIGVSTSHAYRMLEGSRPVSPYITGIARFLGVPESKICPQRKEEP